jgi:hypothetical protein
VTAYHDRFQQIAWQLNNTLLDPDNLAALGLNSLITKTWAVTRQKAVNTQLALGLFTRPLRPTNREPANLALIGSQARLRTSEYAYNTNAVNTHAATVWQFRRTNETWFTPLLTLTNTSSLTELPLPIGSLSLGETYAWRVQYLDAIGHPSSWSAATTFRYGGPTNPAVRLNEILADNVSSVRNGPDTPDYIELLNSTAAEVDLGGWSLTDDLSFPTRFGLPAGTILPAGGYLVVWCDDNTAAPGIHAGFSLKRSGGTIALFAPDAAGAVLADVLQFGRQVSDLSLGRDPSNSLWTVGQPTPADVNQSIALGEVTRLRLNEWAANPKSGSDWFEVFNPESAPVSLADCLFTDDLSAPGKSPVPAFSFIGAGEFAKFTADDNTAAGGDHVAFKLASDGTALALLLTTNRVVDRVFIGSQPTGISGGRIPDGGPIVYSFTTPTPGKRNTADADNDGLPDSWEQTYGLMVGVQDGDADPDGDGLSNRLEYRLGTNPTSAASAFHLEIQIPNGSTGGRLVFLATPNLTYVVERYDLATGLWTPFTTITGLPANRVIEVPLDLTASNDGALFRVSAE